MDKRPLVQRGATLVVALMLLLVVSLLTAFVHERKQLEAESVSPTKMDNRLAEQIARIGIEIGLNEWKYNPTATTDYTENTTVLMDFPIMGGMLNLEFNDADGDFTINPISIKAIATYNASKRQISVTFYRDEYLSMALIKPTSASTEYDARKAGLKALGWHIAEIDEAEPTPDLIAALSGHHQLYVPFKVSDAFFDLATNPGLTDVAIAMATENKAHAFDLGMLSSDTTTLTAPQVDLFPHPIVPPDYCFYCTAFGLPLHPAPMTLVSSSHLFNLVDDADIVSTAYKELSPAPVSPPPSSTSLIFLAKGALRFDLTPAPDTRLMLPIRIDDTQLWSELTNPVGLIDMLDNYLYQSGCGSPACGIQLDVTNWEMNL